MHQTPTLPDTGFLRLPDVLKLYPVSKSTWWKGIHDGKFPAGVRIGARAVAWRAEDIRALIERASDSSLATPMNDQRPRSPKLGVKRLRDRVAKNATQGAAR